MAYTTIDKPDLYFNTVIYAGTGSSHAITVGFQPDWVWIKNRDAGNDHNSYDSIRGATKDLNNNTTNAESTIAEGLKSFDSNGFTVGTNTAHNSGSENYVSWNWLAGGTASSNTDGTITSTVSANTTSGFSIVSYTGTGANATVGTGLGVSPSMIIVKNKGVVGDWRCYHKSLGNTQLIRLNLTNATLTNATWNNTTPTSTVFSIGVNDDVNQNGGNHIAYCFSEIKGFSKFGSYTGNGSTDGTFVYTGFLPAWVMMKRTDTTNDWFIYDSTRNTFNETNLRISANSSSAESTQTTNQIDILSNGFKCRGTAGATNLSGGSYIYMCFAENPFTTSTGIPTTAR